MLAGWLVGALVTLASLAGLVLLVAFVLAPVVVRSTPILQLRSAARAVVMLLYATNFAAGVLGGAAGARRAARWGTTSHRGGVVIGITGPLIAAVGLVAVALAKGYSTPAKVEVVSGLLLLAGAWAGGILVLRSHPGTPVPAVAARAPGGPGMGPAGVAMLMVLASLPWPASAVRTGPFRPARAHLDVASPFDIEASDCTQRSTADEIKGYVTIFSLDLGPTFVFQKKQKADGTWSVTASAGGKVGAKFIEGEKVKTPLISRTLSLEESGHLTFEASDVYDGLKAEADADRLVRWAMVSDLASVFGFGPIGQLATSALLTSLYGSGFTPPSPSEQDVEVGGDLKLELSTFRGAGGRFVPQHAVVGLSLGGGLGIKRSPPDNPDTVTIFSKLNGTATGEAGAPTEVLGELTSGIGGELSGDVVLSLTITRKTVLGQSLLVPNSLSIEATGAFSGEDDFSGTKKGLNELRKTLNGFLGKGIMKKIGKGTGLTVKAGRTLQYQASVDFDQHPDALVSAAAFMAALQADSAENHTSADDARLKQAAQDLADRLDREASVSLLTFDDGSTDATFDVVFGEGLAFGAGGSFELSVQTLSQAQFREPVNGFARSQSCVPAG